MGTGNSTSDSANIRTNAASAAPLRRAYQTVAEQLATLIQEGYEVGQRLPPERELARRYGVSRPTLREALLALSIAGMIEIRSKGGVYVAQRQTTADLAQTGIGPFETIDARLLVEPEVAAMAAMRMNEQILGELESALDEMREANRAGQEANEGDRRFHVAMAAATGNGMLVAVCDMLWRAQLDSPIWDDIHRRMQMERYWDVWLRDHTRIFEAMRAASPVRARAEMIRHLDNIREALLTNSGGPAGDPDDDAPSD